MAKNSNPASDSNETKKSRKALYSEFIPFEATEESKLTKKQRRANRAHGYNLDGSSRSKNKDGKKRADRTYRSLEQRRLDALQEAAELGERIQMAEFAEDDSVKRFSAAIASMRSLMKHDGVECASLLESLSNARAKRIETLRAQ